MFHINSSAKKARSDKKFQSFFLRLKELYTSNAPLSEIISLCQKAKIHFLPTYDPNSTEVFFQDLVQSVETNDNNNTLSSIYYYLFFIWHEQQAIVTLFKKGEMQLIVDLMQKGNFIALDILETIEYRQLGHDSFYDMDLNSLSDHPIDNYLKALFTRGMLIPLDQLSEKFPGYQFFEYKQAIILGDTNKLETLSENNYALASYFLACIHLKERNKEFDKANTDDFNYENAMVHEKLTLQYLKLAITQGLIFPSLIPEQKPRGIPATHGSIIGLSPVTVLFHLLNNIALRDQAVQCLIDSDIVRERAFQIVVGKNDPEDQPEMDDFLDKIPENTDDNDPRLKLLIEQEETYLAYMNTVECTDTAKFQHSNLGQQLKIEPNINFMPDKHMNIANTSEIKAIYKLIKGDIFKLEEQLTSELQHDTIQLTRDALRPKG